MPTAAKLVAAVAFAALAFFAAEIFKGAMPDRTVWGLFNPICAAVGALCGWFVMGGLAGHGYQAATGYGIRTAITCLFWVVILFSIYEAVKRSTKMRYDGPMEAVLGMFDLALEYLQLMVTAPMIAAVLLGGALAGALTEWAGRRWN